MQVLPYGDVALQQHRSPIGVTVADIMYMS